jgi:hypothetical protein
MSDQKNSNIGSILGGIAAVITAISGVYYALSDKAPKTPKIPEYKAGLTSPSSDSIVADGFWESQKSGQIREIRLTDNGLKLKSGGDWFLYDRVSTNLYRREKSNGGQITLIVVDKNTVKQIASDGNEVIWVRSKAE